MNAENQRCGTCMFWRQPWREVTEGAVHDAPAATEVAVWGVCAVIRHPGRGEYSLEAAERHGWPVLPPRSRRAYTADGSDYKSELNTRENFGCVEWAPTEDA